MPMPLSILRGPKSELKQLQRPTDKIPVMVSGLPLPMALEAAKRIARSDEFRLHDSALTDSITEQESMEIEGRPIQLYTLSQREFFKIAESFPSNGIVVDLASQDSFLDNMTYFCRNGMNFITGTTRPVDVPYRRVQKIVSDNMVRAVVAPDLCKQVAALEGALVRFKARYGGREQLGILWDAGLEISESRPRGNTDASGTVYSTIEELRKMGIDFSPDQIRQIRDPLDQLALGVPKEHLHVHNWVSYTFTAIGTSDNLNELRKGVANMLAYDKAFFASEVTKRNSLEMERVSADGKVLFSMGYAKNPAGYGLRGGTKLVITHRVNGLDPYMSGLFDALRCQKEGKLASGQVYKMHEITNLSDTS